MAVAFLPMGHSRIRTLRALRKYPLPPSDIIEWLHHGYLCVWRGGEVPIQPLFAPVQTPEMPAKFTYRYGGCGYEYTQRELLAALRMDKVPRYSLMHNPYPKFSYPDNRIPYLITTLPSLGFRPRTVEVMLKHLPVGPECSGLTYPNNIVQYVTWEGLLANILDALEDDLFKWQWAPYGRGLDVHWPGVRAWWARTMPERWLIAGLVREHSRVVKSPFRGGKVTSLRRIEGVQGGPS